MIPIYTLKIIAPRLIICTLEPIETFLERRLMLALIREYAIYAITQACPPVIVMSVIFVARRSMQSNLY